MNLVLSLLLLIGSGSLAEDAQPAGKPLIDLLERLDRIAGLYRDGALKFACDERITYSRQGLPDKVYRFDYIYVYDVPRGLTDYRTRHPDRSGADAVAGPVDLDMYDLPAFLDRAYSWVFTFERAKQGMYHYEIVREETILGRAAVAIRFEPVPPWRQDINDWYGTAWIDSETFMFLRVEALKADQYEEKMRFERNLREGLPPDKDLKWTMEYAFTQISTDFSVEKNGMRFPGKVLIDKSRFEVTETDYYRTHAALPGFTITQTYDDYRFFGVRTQDEIRLIVAGEESEPPRRPPP